MKSSFVPAILAGLFFANGASAATQNFSDSSNRTNSPSVFMDQLDIAQFDPTLGTLTQVELFFAVSANGSDRDIGTFGQPGNAEARFDASFSFGGFLIGDTDLDQGQCGVSVSGATCLAFAKADVAASSSETLIAGIDDLSAFIGTGNVANAINVNSFDTDSANVFANARVTYTFDEPAAVPLPAGAPLLLAGLGAFVALRRRKAA